MGATARPNLILVMTDDQGYGDLGCTGNPWIQTPNLNRFHDESVRFTDFHVSALCTPTRGAIMTGRNPLRNGAWATCWGRSILRRDEMTMADVFAASGYATGMFGKWHLGDNYPYRPQDRGFQKVVAHKGGGVGQTPDFWGNSYFDDTYFHNGEPRAHEGYCTDIWFDEALAFIEENRERPFFCYLATNAPHSPYLVAERYKKLYDANTDIPEPAFYGMITNIDENFARLRTRLDELGLGENTILIFMTDNGSSGGCRLDGRQFVNMGFNAGMRGKKGAFYDGGHRVPFFLRWPAGGFDGGRDVGDLCVHMDMLPTFMDLCDLRPPEEVEFDGRSFAPLLRGEADELPDRTVFVQNRQSTQPPEKWRNCVMTRQWRLVHGGELFDMAADPGQREDVSSRHPDVVERMRAAHDAWWEEVSPLFEKFCPISLGAEEENPTTLCAMDVLGDVAWNQPHIREAMKSTGTWAVSVERPGEYEFRCRRWPRELGLPLDAVLKEIESVPLHPKKARLKIAGFEETVDAPPGAEYVTFRTQLEPGETRLDAWFIHDDGEERGAYYVDVERLS